MIESLKDILLVSDIDGTLLKSENGISKENLEAIKRFVEKGGHFTVATGRVVEAARVLLKGVPITDPSINVNGGYIYDWDKNDILSANYINPNAKYICKKIISKFPFCDCHFSNEYAINLLTAGDTLSKYAFSTKIHKFNGSFDDVPDKIFKYIICCDPEKMPEVREYASMIAGRDVKVFQSSDFYLEINPKNNSKENGLKELCNITGYSLDNVVACGDYENDIGFIKAAGIGVAVENAQDSVKEAADIVVPSVDDNGIAHLIELLEDMYG